MFITKSNLDFATVAVLKKMTIEHLRNNALGLPTKQSGAKLEKVLLIVLAQSKNDPALLSLIIDYRSYLSRALKMKKLGLRFNAAQRKQYEALAVQSLLILDKFK